MSTPYPCLDDSRRYRSFPCSQCKAASCWMGKKPTARPAGVSADGYPICEGCNKPVLPTRRNQVMIPDRHPGCPRICGHCKAPYAPHGRGLYCSEACRYEAMMWRRKARRKAGKRDVRVW